MNLELSMRADALRFSGVDKNAAKKQWAPMERVQPKPNEPAQGGFVSRNPGRSGEGGVTPEQPVGVLKLSCRETHAKSLSQKSVR
jgi:hypothetical protein